MEDIPNPFASPAHTTPTAQGRTRGAYDGTTLPSDRPQKRRRTHRATTIDDLPVETLCKILRDLHPTRRSSNDAIQLSDIRPLFPLRTLNRLFRDAFDAHIISLNLCGVPAERFARLLTTMLPRFQNLTCLALPSEALSASLQPHWQHFFTMSQARLQHVIFVHVRNEEAVARAQTADGTIPMLLAHGCRKSLERVSTSCSAVLTAIGTYPNNISMLQLMMDDIPEEKLMAFRSLQSLFLLYRKPLQHDRAVRLVQVLHAIKHASLSVHLRLNKLTSNQFGLFPSIPGLRKVSLFDGAIAPDNRGMNHIASCRQLEDVHFEHIEQLSGEDIANLATGMRERLRNLRIWNCSQVTDHGLVAVANLCPRVEVDLRFFRDQFSHQALGALGDRVSWGSYAF